MAKNKKNLLHYENGKTVELDSDDAPELTATLFKKMRPAKEVLEQLFGKKKADTLLAGKAKIRAVGRPLSEKPKEQITLRLSAEVTKAIKNSGAGYNARVEAILRKEFIQPSL